MLERFGLDWFWTASVFAAIPPVVVMAWLFRRIALFPAGPRAYLKWIPALACVGVILIFAGSYFSYTHTDRFVRAVLRMIDPSLSPQAVYNVHVVVRKTAHPLEYAVLYLVMANGPMRRHRGAALALCAVLALLDEGIQSLLPSRSGLFSDSVLDFAGAATAWLVDLAFGAKMPRSTALSDAA